MSHTRRKVFISYHHADKDEVNEFIKTFSNDRDVFITRALGAGMDQNIIDSKDTSYVMRRIRELYLKDSTVTLVMFGKCTWARKYVDWEIQASLRNSDNITPNGLLGVKLPSYDEDEGYYPNRLNKNLLQDGDDDCYARVINYPTRKDYLINWIEDAFNARSSRKSLINNPRDRFGYNRTCP
ncbi:MAG: TIR domain-containing protein [Methanobacteriaceae archaeon]|nr:TIR domain-containing protein [Methanobacteriaceae archaeon]